MMIYYYKRKYAHKEVSSHVRTDLALVFPPTWIASNMDSIILSHSEFLGVLLNWPVKKQSTY